MNTWYTLTIPSVTESIRDVEEAVAELLEEAEFSENDIFAVRLALDEAMANAIKHGNLYDATKKVSVKYSLENNGIVIVVADEGKGFNYEDLPDPTAPDRLELPSGRGLLLMYSYMDSVSFNERGNEVTMVKGRGIEE